MRKIRKLLLEQVGSDLCLTYQGQTRHDIGILGTVDPDKLDELASAARLASNRYKERNGEEFNAVVYEG